jgi:hypothetical protein
VRAPALAAFALAFALSCTSPVGQPALQQRLVDAGLEGWAEAGLPDPPSTCGLQWFDVAFARDEAEFYAICPANAGGACLYGWVVVIRPGLRGDVVERLAVHELMHLLRLCTLGSMGYDHKDERVFGNDNGSAENEARDILGAGHE